MIAKIPKPLPKDTFIKITPIVFIAHIFFVTFNLAQFLRLRSIILKNLKKIYKNIFALQQQKISAEVSLIYKANN